MAPVECVARGHLAGSGPEEYRRDGTVCGIALPEGLVDGSEPPEPIFTPATKAEVGDHDQNVSFETVAAAHGEKSTAEPRDLILRVYERGRRIARERGILLADTEFEFGRDASGEPVPADEVFTPDSSRYRPPTSGLPDVLGPPSTSSTSRCCGTGRAHRRRVGTGTRRPLHRLCPSTWCSALATAMPRSTSA